MAKCDFSKKITLWHGCSPVNLLYIFRTPFYKNTYGGLLLKKSKKTKKNSYTTELQKESLYHHVK